MRTIFADTCRDDWYEIFVDLAGLGAYKYCQHFNVSTEEVYADIIMIDSFDHLIAFEDLFGQNKKFKRSERLRPYEFILLTSDSEEEKLNPTVVNAGNLYICDRRVAAELIIFLWGKHDIERETLLADRPKFVTSFKDRMNQFFTENIVPVFDDE